jgi:hypothetical protein
MPLWQNQSLVVKAWQVQHGGVQVAGRDRIFAGAMIEWLQTELFITQLSKRREHR